MQLGQTADPSIGFDPYGETFTGRPEPDPVTFAADGGSSGGTPQLLIDPATAAMLAQEFGPAVVVDDLVADVAVGTPVSVEPDPKLSLVAVGIGVALVGGALWYFSR